MPDRIVRAGILTSEPINALSWAAEIFYRRLINAVDDYGRFDGRCSILRASLYPLKLDRVSERDVGTWLRNCEEAGLVTVYTVNDRPYIEILKFDQRLRAKTSKWPPPPSSVSTCQQLTADATEADTETESNSESGTTGQISDEISGTPPVLQEKNGVPYEKIVSLYHEKLPELPRCAKLTGQRRGYIRQRWLEDLQNLQDWEKYFGIVRQSSFLMGKNKGSDGRPPFRADLAWLCRPENIVKVIEGKYHR